MNDELKDINLRYDLEHKEELYRLYYRVDREVEKSKSRRSALVWIGHILVFLIVAITWFSISSVFALLACLFISVMFGSILYWVEFSIFSWLFTMNREDHERQEYIAERIKRVKDIEQQNQ